MAEEKILKRSEVPEEYTWNLKDMFESDEAWLAEFEALKAYPEIVAKFQGTLFSNILNLRMNSKSASAPFIPTQAAAATRI